MTVPFDIWCSVMGLSVQALANYMTKRPFYVGIHKYAAFGAVGYVIGTQVDRFRDQRMKEKELILYDYIARHPDDFDDGPPKKYADILDPWFPSR